MGFNDDVRIIKYYLGIKTILLSPIDLLFGMNREMFTQLRILNTRISDNSIMYLIMYFGVPYTCFLFFSIYSVCIKYFNINIFFIIIFIILILNLFLTGAIFWHVYLLYFSSTLVLIFKKFE